MIQKQDHEQGQEEDEQQTRRNRKEGGRIAARGGE
jgi:hypothetical protein